jgi:hypothetical protein
MSVVGGVALAAARIPLRGAWAIMVAVLIATAGWGADVIRRRSPRNADRDEVTERPQFVH